MASAMKEVLPKVFSEDNSKPLVFYRNRSKKVMFVTAAEYNMGCYLSAKDAEIIKAACGGKIGKTGVAKSGNKIAEEITKAFTNNAEFLAGDDDKITLKLNIVYLLKSSLIVKALNTGVTEIAKGRDVSALEKTALKYFPSETTNTDQITIEISKKQMKIVQKSDDGKRDHEKVATGDDFELIKELAFHLWFFGGEVPSDSEGLYAF